MDHLLVLCEAGGDSDEEILAFYQDIADRFLERVSEHYDRVKIHGVRSVRHAAGETVLSMHRTMHAMHAGASGIVIQIRLLLFRRPAPRSIKKASIIPNFEHAIDTDGIQVYLQPKCSAKNDRIIGAEALSRFCDEDGEILSPAIYVPILEQAGIVSRLDYQVLVKSVELLSKWRDDGHELFPISVNLSRVDLLEDRFIESLDHLVGRCRAGQTIYRI